MKVFLIKILASFFLVLLICALYILKDPYEDFGNHTNYSWKFHFQALGDISTKKLLNSTVRYNTFILGSSRTTSLYACYLQKK